MCDDLTVHYEHWFLWLQGSIMNSICAGIALYFQFAEGGGAIQLHIPFHGSKAIEQFHFHFLEYFSVASKIQIPNFKGYKSIVTLHVTVGLSSIAWVNVIRYVNLKHKVVNDIWLFHCCEVIVNRFEWLKHAISQ